jgi:putative glutamine amidotransferase
MARPVIGITAYSERAAWGPWETEAVLLPLAYVQAVEDAGGVPVLLPPSQCSAEEAAAIVSRLDGLVLAGGADIDPVRYAAAAHPETAGLRPQRDASELALNRAAAALDLPVLGVCRGMQLMAVDAGGALHQHMPDVVGSEKHRPRPGQYGSHGARFAPGSLVEAILGSSLTVNSHHHQGVESPGSLSVTGWADDGTLEVLEDSARLFAVGVQWHPEVTEDRRLFDALVKAATPPGSS